MNKCKCGHYYFWDHFIIVTNNHKTERKLCKICDCDEKREAWF